jgi:phosphatidylglycerol---prolipoprotein diacylglyceryl transferase
VQKIAFEIGSLPIHWYGVLVALGFILGLWTASRRGLLQGIPPEKVLDSGPWLILGAIVGARALYVVSYWEKLMETPLFPRMPWTEIFMIQRGGLVYYGGLIGAIASGVIYIRLRRLPIWKFADTMAPSIALGYVPGRIGCLMNGCCYGKPTSLPWGIEFPAGHEMHRIPIHPTQVYDSVLNLLLYLALAWLYRRKKFDGQIFALYLLGYAVARSVVEMFRGDYADTSRYLGGVVTPAHLVSILTFLSGAILYALLAARKKSGPSPERRNVAAR